MELRQLFGGHSRHWREFVYVYPVISRRAKGLSIGINLNPDGACNFDCVYCQVDRTVTPRVRTVDLAVLERELRHLVGNYRKLFEEREFRHVPDVYRRLNDIAFSGDGEPTASPVFLDAVRVAVGLRRGFAVPEAKIIIITDACFLTRPKVAEALALLDANNGEIWAKLDAGTEEYYRLVNRPGHPLQHVLDNILTAARIRPVVIQSLFMRLHNEPPAAAEISAYVERLRALGAQGGHIGLVQIYSIARRPAEPFAAALNADELERIAAPVRALGLPVEVYA